jgi:paraquat-inducible protein A
VLVAALKLGNVMDVTPGPAALAFTVCVVLSLLATASFDPHSVWEDTETPTKELEPQMNADERR